eukprot:6994294-Prymnesium_polylepis.1
MLCANDKNEEHCNAGVGLSRSALLSVGLAPRDEHAAEELAGLGRVVPANFLAHDARPIVAEERGLVQQRRAPLSCNLRAKVPPQTLGNPCGKYPNRVFSPSLPGPARPPQTSHFPKDKCCFAGC